MSSFTEASSSSATPTAVHPSTKFIDAEKVSTDCHTDVIQLNLSQEHYMHEDDTSRDLFSSDDAKVRELESRLSVANRVAEFAKQQLLLSEHERHANSIQLSELKLELRQAQEQIRAKEGTIAFYGSQDDQRTLQLEEISAQMSSMQHDESHIYTVETHNKEMKRFDEENQSLLRKIEQMEAKYKNLEGEADAMRNRAFTAEGKVQLVEAKLKSSVSQYECKLEEAHKLNQFLEGKVVQIETQGADKEFEYKEKERLLEADLFQWRQKAENIEDELEHIVSSYDKRIEELQEEVTIAHNESGKLRLALNQVERARENLATIVRQTEKEVTKLRSFLQENDARAQSERDERDRNIQMLEEAQRRLLETEGRLNVSNQLNDFYKNKLVVLEEEKAMRVPIVAQNAVLKKKLHDREKHLDDTTLQCSVQAEKIERLGNEVDTMKASHNRAIEALEAGVSTLVTKEVSLRAEVDHLRIRLASADEENHLLKNKISAIEGQLSAVVEEKDQLQYSLKELEETKKCEDAARKEQFKELDIQLKELQSKGDYLEFQLAEREADTNGQLSVLESQLESTLFQVASLENDILYLNEQKLLSEATYVDQVRDLENQLKQSANELALLKDEALIMAADTAEEYHKLKRAIAKLQAHCDECRSELVMTKSQLDEREAQVSSLQHDSARKIEDLAHVIKSRTHINDKLNDKLVKSEAKSRDLQSQVNELQARLADSACVAKTLTDQLTEIRKTAQEQISSLKSELQENSQKLLETQQHLVEAQQDVRLKKQQISDFDTQLPLINRKIFYLEAEVNYAKDEVLLFQNKLKVQTDEFQSQLGIERDKRDLLRAETGLKSDKLNDLEATVEMLQTGLGETTSDLGEAKSQVANKERSNKELTSKIIELKSQLFESQNVIDALRAKLSRAQWKGENKGEKAHKVSLKEITRDYEREVTKLKEKIVMLEEDKLRNMEHVRLLESNFM
jgi:chromosome segregation ATPase